jgi:hypothetical protein
MNGKDCFLLNHTNLSSALWKLEGSLPYRITDGFSMGSCSSMHTALIRAPTLTSPGTHQPLSSPLVLFIPHCILQLAHMTSLSPCFVFHPRHTYDLSHQCCQICTTAFYRVDASFPCLASSCSLCSQRLPMGTDDLSCCSLSCFLK